MENKVINVQMDEETFKKFQSGGGNGGNSGGGEEIGLIYVTKESIFTALGIPMPEDVPQSDFQDLVNNLVPLLGIRALKRASGSKYDIEQGVSNAIVENWLTYSNWTAAALYFDTPMLKHGEWIKTWAVFGATTLEEAKAAIAQMFPNQLTEEEFLS
jgi:hypothetical protein